MKKLKHSFGSIYNPMTMETFVEIEDVAKCLAKNWGDIPKHLNDTRAMELHLLGKAYLNLLKRNGKPTNQGAILKGSGDEH